MKSIRIGDDRDTVKALRAIYVRDFDSLEKRHDRYVECNAPNYSPNDLEGEKPWIQAVIYEHQKVLSDCDDYLAQTKPKSASVASGVSSRHSSASSRLAQIHEAERKEKEAELMLEQIEDETRRREEEDEKIRESEANIRDLEDYRRQVEIDRRQRELRDEIDRQRLSGTIMQIWQKLVNLTVDDQTRPIRAPSIVSGLSRASRISSHLLSHTTRSFSVKRQPRLCKCQMCRLRAHGAVRRIMATLQPQPNIVTAPTTPMPTVSNSVTPPTPGVPYGPTSIVPRTSTSVTTPIPTLPPTPFTPVTTATIRTPMTISTSSWFSSWRNTHRNLFGPTPPAQPPFLPPASSVNHSWPPNPPPTTSIGTNTVPASTVLSSTIPTNITQNTAL
ncbi:hypothetical protein GHT06_005447 [Daphnia sinensis]|uniref:Uncharacterized protein n=1 Tax=Daphnia sinensis TaxID=1820382 RepID=A0AAD5KV52_9CRUS|nr:hypothetical protein GHT06_005447 [Daphnia sinensis]